MKIVLASNNAGKLAELQTLLLPLDMTLVRQSDLGIGEATRLSLAASTLNLALPSKMGDVAKAWVLVYRHRFAGERALSLVVFEKMLDMASLLAWGVPALLWVGGRDAVYWLAAAAVGGLFLLLALLLAPVPLTATLLRLLAERTRRLKPDKNIAVEDAGDQHLLPFHHHVSRKFPPILQQGLPVFRPERIIPCPCIAKGNAIRRAAYSFFG